MDGIKNISIRAVVQSDMDAVIELLQSMSEFKPLKSDFFLYDQECIFFLWQNNFFYVFLYIINISTFRYKICLK